VKNKEKQELERLQKKADELWQWLMGNINDPEWSQKKSLYNALTVKIDNCKKRIYYQKHKNNEEPGKTYYMPSNTTNYIE
jgi:hypothetical protein